MSLTAANPGGWSLNEVLTSAQMTHLQNELLKAIDGVNGGTYTLASPLEFAGADVRIAADLEVISGGEINIQNGGALNVLAGGVIDFSGDLHISSGGELVVESGGLLTLQNGSDMAVDGTALITLDGTLLVDAGGSIEVNGSGAINLNVGSDMTVTSADITVNGGGQIILAGGSLIVSTGFVQCNGGDINMTAGSFINAGAGAGVNLEDAEDLTINGSNETFRLTLVPVLNDPLGPWERTTPGSGLLGWYQFDVAAVRRIWFAIPVPPGDDLVDVFVRVDGDAMGVGPHAALPATMPQIDLFTVDINGQLSAALATKVDPSGSAAVYDGVHNIILQNGSLTSGTMPRTATQSPFYVRVSGEFGANSQLGLTILSITGNVTARSYRNDEAVWS